MNAKSFHVLEFQFIKQRLQEYCVSPSAKRRAEALVPFTTQAEVTDQLAETTEAFNAIVKKDVHIGVIGDLNYSLKMAEIGSSLNPGQLLYIGDTLRTARRLKAYVDDVHKNFAAVPMLMGYAQVMGHFKAIEETIERAIISEDHIADDASTKLRQIRRSIEVKQAQIRERLDRIITSSSMQKYLQDNIVTIRQDRFVVPVKSEHKSHIKGIVHDQSGSGATAYIEPMAIVNFNNDLRELAIEEKREIERILLAITQQIGEWAPDIRITLEALIALDFIFAKAKLSVSMRASAASVGDAMQIRIKNGKHPLIDSQDVVPINFHIGEGFSSLLITGPNTGGKTVTLKTVGLFALMTQSGLHIPADHGSYFPVFSGVFADIGDEQSIAQSLSTFSSHMTNIVSIIDCIDNRSLVLFDELGAGTDPTEGAALAMAILKHVNQRGALCVATTHYSELKHFALATAGFNNASVEFDVATLSPTYRLLIGIPGKSNAFEISRKLGLSNAIIDVANGLLDNDNIAFEDVLAAIEDNRREAEMARDEALRLKRDAERLHDKQVQRERQFDERKARFIDEAKAEARQLVKDAKRESEALIKEIQDMKHQTTIDTKRLDAIKRDLAAKDKALRTGLAKQTAGDVPRSVNIGQEIMIASLGQKGSVIALPDQKGDVQLQVGIMKMMANIADLRIVQDQRRKGVKSVKRATSTDISASVVKREVDLRGQNLDDARLNLDKYLDDAAVSKHESVTVIHGVGTGVLKRGLTTFLKKHPHVKSARPGAYGEGGAGVTIVTLK